ncbi:MAG TPA: lysyl oxidase family protein [Thermoleophilaceae bacterium]
MTAARDIIRWARRGAPLAATVALLALPALAQADPTPLLPDLVQEPPPVTSIQVGTDTDTNDWAITFSSIVGNIGQGPMQIDGQLGTDAPDMTAYQVIQMSDGTTTEDLTHPIGHVHYDTDPSHNHWHFQPFDDYELRSLDGSQVFSDQKEGFCLVNSLQVPFAGIRGAQGEFTIGAPGDPGYFCNLGHPEAESIREGISIGWADEYTGIRSGTDVDLTGVPAGRYVLVQQVNTDQSIQELDYSNNAWSAVVDISWPSGPSGAPKAIVRTTCPGTATCSFTDPPPPPPAPPTAKDRKPPVMLLGGATRQRFLRNRSIYVYAKCNEICTVRASGRIAALQIASSLRTSSVKKTLKPGARTKLNLPVSARVRRLINKQLRKRGARVTVRVTITAVDASGNHMSTKRTLVLLPRDA